MIKFQVLVIKTETNDMHAILLLKKNVQTDIIKTILGYLPIVASESLRKWKVAITSVGQGYESTESQQDYRIGKETMYGGKSILMDIEKARENFEKNRKPKYFSCNVYGHMAKKCRKPKNE